MKTVQTNTLAADIDLVVYGIATHITEKDLYEHMWRTGLSVVRCMLLTTYEHARSLTFKLTIKASDYEKSQDPAIWPSGVSVKPYKEKKNNRKKVNDGASERHGISLNGNRTQHTLVGNNWLRQPATYQ